MPTLEDQAICIRRWNFSETSQTVSFLTRNYGVLRGLAKGAKRERGAFSGGFDMLAVGQIIAIVKPGRDLSTLTQWDLERTFPVLRRNLAANRVAWLMADLVHHLVTGVDPHPVTYDALVGGLTALDEHNAAVTLLRFQWQLLVDCGYQPELHHDADTGAPLSDEDDTWAFSPGAGGVVLDTGGRDRWRVRRPTIEFMRAFVASDGSVEVEAETVERANRLLTTYACHLIGKEPGAARWAARE